jgi:hypothetical protein
MCVESRTSYRWAYLRRDKKPPIKLIVWFVKYLRRFFGFPLCVIRNDGGGELCGSLLLKKTLSELNPPVLMKPTGAKTSSANCKAERSIGVAGVTTQLLLGMANVEVIYWCFALLKATTAVVVYEDLCLAYGCNPGIHLEGLSCAPL